MRPIKFPQHTHVLAEDQPEYEPLPVHVDQSAPGTPFTACFELSDEEVAEIVRTKKLYYTQLTCGGLFHPVLLSTLNPFVETESTTEFSENPELAEESARRV